MAHGRHRRRIARLAAGAAATAAAPLTALYFASLLDRQALRVAQPGDRYNLRIAALDDGRITLERRGRLERSWLGGGLLGLQWPGGYGRVSTVHERDSRRSVRDFIPVIGDPPIGAAARLDTFAYPRDPSDLGLDFEDVSISGELGELPAWHLPGGDDWAILVHGKGASRREMLRSLPPVLAAGCSALVISYRNDPGAPRSPDGRYRFGATEWADLEAAARFALDRGARRLVLLGNSMGGGVVMSFLYRSALAERVAGVILDSPLLCFGDTVAARAPRWLPRPVLGVGKRLAGWRFAVDWAAVDYLGRAAELRVPLLLFHGTADADVPIGTSDRLTALRPDLVTCVRREGVHHVRCWNDDPAAYEAAIAAFLARVLPTCA